MSEWAAERLPDGDLAIIREQCEPPEPLYSHAWVAGRYLMHCRRLLKHIDAQQAELEAARAVCEWAKDAIEDRPELQYDELSGVQELLEAYDAARTGQEGET